MGTMTFGSSTSKDEAFKILDKAYDRGINFFDMQNYILLVLKKRLLEILKNSRRVA